MFGDRSNPDRTMGRVGLAPQRLPVWVYSVPSRLRGKEQQAWNTQLRTVSTHSSASHALFTGFQPRGFYSLSFDVWGDYSRLWPTRAVRWWIEAQRYSDR